MYMSFLAQSVSCKFLKSFSQSTNGSLPPWFALAPPFFFLWQQFHCLEVSYRLSQIIAVNTFHIRGKHVSSQKLMTSFPFSLFFVINTVRTILEKKGRVKYIEEGTIFFFCIVVGSLRYRCRLWGHYKLSPGGFLGWALQKLFFSRG